MKLFLRIPDESGLEIFISVYQISTVRFAVTRKKGLEMATIRMADGQVFEIKADLFDAELEALDASDVAPTPPAPAEEAESVKAVEVVKRASRKKSA